MTSQAPTIPATLTRSLGLRSVVLFGLAYLAPMIVLGTFGVLAHTTKGTAPTGYLLALVALLFTAMSYGKMSARFPVAGSAYTYTRRAIDSRLGFLVGWAVLLDYFFLPMVIWLIRQPSCRPSSPGSRTGCGSWASSLSPRPSTSSGSRPQPPPT